MDTEPICLSLGLSLGPLETLSNIIVKPNSLCLGLGIGLITLLISVAQCIKATRKPLREDCTTVIRTQLDIA